MRSYFIVSLLALLGATAVAQEATPDHWTQVPSVSSRAEVKASVRAGVEDGSLARHEVASLQLPRITGSTLSRAQVRAEAIEAMRLGLVQSGEATGRVATPQELAQIHAAGLRAVQDSHYAAK